MRLRHIDEAIEYTARLAGAQMALNEPSLCGHRECAQNEVNLFGCNMVIYISYIVCCKPRVSYELKTKLPIDLAGESKRGLPRSL